MDGLKVKNHSVHAGSCRFIRGNPLINDFGTGKYCIIRTKYRCNNDSENKNRNHNLKQGKTAVRMPDAGFGGSVNGVMLIFSDFLCISKLITPA